MANYDEPLPTSTNPVPQVKRVRYFDTQLLHDQDFVDQQMYEIVQRNRRNQLLHVAGIAGGLDVTQVGTLGTATQLQVSQGSAFDSNGRHIMLSALTVLSVPAATGTAPPPGAMSVYIQFREDATDPPSPGKSTRWTQNPNMLFIAPAGAVPSDALLLATLSLNAQRQITAISKTGRIYTGVNLPVPAGAPSLTLRAGGDALPGTADFNGNLRLASGTVTANAVATNTLTTNALTTSAFTTSALTTSTLTTSTLTTNALSVGGSAASSGSPLTVSSSSAHLQLRRAATETARGAILYLELFQDATAAGDNTHPCIRFHHSNRFWHRLQAQADGLHVKTGDLGQDGYSGLRASIGTFDALACNGSITTGNNQGGSGSRLNLAGGDASHYIYSTGSGGNRCVFGEGDGGWHFQNTISKLEVASVDGSGGFRSRSGALYSESDGGWRFHHVFKDDQPELLASIDGSGGFHSRSGALYSESDDGWRFHHVFKDQPDLVASIDVGGGFHSRSGIFQNDVSGHRLCLKEDGNVVIVDRDGVVLSIWKVGEGKSDLRLKRDLRDLGGALERVARLRPVRFRYQGPFDDGHEHLGLIAQEVEEEFPELVDTDPDGYKRVHYARLSSVLVQAIQELNARLDALESEEKRHGD